MKRKIEESSVEEVKGEEEKGEVHEPKAKRQKTDDQCEDQQEQKESLYLDKLKLASFDGLNELAGSRKDCPKCHVSRKYFCYDCFLPLNNDLS